MKHKHVQALLEKHGLTGGTGFHNYNDAALHPDHKPTQKELFAALDELLFERVRSNRVQAFASEYKEATYGEEWR